MDFNNLSPYVRVAQDCIVEPSVSLRKRVIFDYELVYIKSGEIELLVENKQYKCTPGDIIFIQPKITHECHIIGKKPLQQPHVHFDLFFQPDSLDVKVSFRPLERISKNEMHWFREPLTMQAIRNFPVVLRPQYPDLFEGFLYSLIEEYKNHMPFREIAVKGLFIQLWTYYLREVYLMQNRNLHFYNPALIKIKEILNSNLYRSITLDEIAAKAHLSKHYICHIFQKSYGISPLKYHKLARISKAKELIQFSDKAIGQIAEQIGYQSVFAFSRAFKSVEKVAPSFYR